MDRRRVSVSSMVVLLLLTLVHSSTASTSRKAALNKRQQINSRSRTTRARSTRPKSAGAHSTKSCAPCAAATARKGRARAKRASKTNDIPCHPRDYVDPKIAKNYKAAMRDLKRAGIRPRVTSVWRSSAKQAQLHRCSLSTRCRRSNPGLYRALPAGSSIHESGFAVDIAGVATGRRGAKRLTPQGRRIIAIMKKHGFNWRYGLADPVHFEADPRKYGYRSVRHAIARTQTTCQVKFAKSKTQKKPSGKIAVSRKQRSGRLRVSARGGPTRARAATKATV